MALAALTPLILSIDDDPLISELLGELLTQAGYRAACYTDADPALEAMRSGSLQPDLILLDLVMPGRDGYSICRALQADPVLALIPVVFLTGEGGTAQRLQAFQLGAVGFLEKPLEPSALLAQIEKFLQVGRRWQQSFTGADPDPGAAQSVTALVPAPQRPLPERAGPRELVPVRRSSFAGFRQFLSEVTGKPLPGPSSPDELYALGPALGLAAEQLARLVASYTRLDYLESLDPAQVSLGVLPAPFCRRYLALAIGEGDATAFVLSNPFYLELEDTLRRFSVSKRYIAAPDLIRTLCRAHLDAPAPGSESLTDVADELESLYQPVIAPAAQPESDEQSAPVVRLVNRMIEEAWRQRASDIHLEPGETDVTVRYRIDGELREVKRLQPAALIHPLAARIKVMAGLNIAEKRLPQDGRIVFKQHGSGRLDLDLRVATAPMIFGEKVVMRLIDKQKTTLPLEALGFSPRNLERYLAQLRSPYGMILHVGPTGSGKSMTLYAALNGIRRPGINIQTAEDPVEYTLPGINQLQIKAEIGLDFARVLRAYLRQDPDVILVGEIRDLETAEVALEAALTGHLLLSTLHTNDAASTLTRFLEMGIPPFLVSASVVMICAQRLLRRLCEQCRVQVEAGPDQKLALAWPEARPLPIWQSGGCEACDGIGYRGRIGVHELLIPSDSLRRSLSQPGITAEALKQQAVAEGMTTLWWDGVDKALQGLTSLDEVSLRLRADEFDSRPDWWRARLQA